MCRETNLLNHTYSINRKEKIPSEIELCLNTSSGSIQYTFVFLSIVRFLKQYLDEKSKQDCHSVVLFGNESNEYLISCLIKLGLDKIYPVSPFLYFVNPAKFIPASSCSILLVCGGLNSDVYFVNRKERKQSNKRFFLSKEAIINSLEERASENYKKKSGNSLLESLNLPDCIESCCTNFVENLQQGSNSRSLIVESPIEQSKLLLLHQLLFECYHALCDETLNALMQQQPNSAVLLIGEGALFDTLKQLAVKYRLQLVSEYSSLCEICDNIEKYRLDFLTNGTGSLISIRRFLGSLMPNYSSAASLCWSDMDNPYPLSLIPSSIESSVEKKPLKRAESDGEDCVLKSVGQPKLPFRKSSLASTLSLGFFSESSAYPLLVYSSSADWGHWDAGWLASCFTRVDEQAVRRYLNKDDVYKISVKSFEEGRNAFIVSSSLLNQSLVLRYEESIEWRMLSRELLDGVMIMRDPFLSIVGHEEGRVAFHSEFWDASEVEKGKDGRNGNENENVIQSQMRSVNKAEVSVNAVLEEGNQAILKSQNENENPNDSQSQSQNQNQSHNQSQSQNQYQNQNQNQNQSQNQNSDTAQSTAPTSNQTGPEVLLDSSSLSQTDPIDFLNEDSIDSNPIENEWIQFCLSASINSSTCTNKEFEDWLSSQDLENDSVFSILSQSKDKAAEVRTHSHSSELDCVAFHEYPLTEDDLLSRHTQWKVLKDQIFDGDVLLYQGDISGDKLNGNGKWYYKNRTVLYEGEFSSNLWDGHGCAYYPNGTLFYKGHWKKGKMNGMGELYKPINLQYCNAQQRKYIWDNEGKDNLSIAKSYKSKFNSFK